MRDEVLEELSKDDDTFESSTLCYYFVGFAFSTGSYRGFSVSE